MVTSFNWDMGLGSSSRHSDSRIRADFRSKLENEKLPKDQAYLSSWPGTLGDFSALLNRAITRRAGFVYARSSR